MSYKPDYFFIKEFWFWQTLKFIFEICSVLQWRTHNVIESWFAKGGSIRVYYWPLAAGGAEFWLWVGPWEALEGGGWSHPSLHPHLDEADHRLLLPLVISGCRWSLLIIFHNNKSVPANPIRISEHYFQRGNKKNLKDRKAGLAAQRDKGGQGRQMTWELSMVSSTWISSLVEKSPHLHL